MATTSKTAAKPRPANSSKAGNSKAAATKVKQRAKTPAKAPKTTAPKTAKQVAVVAKKATVQKNISSTKIPVKKEPALKKTGATKAAPKKTTQIAHSTTKTKTIKKPATQSMASIPVVRKTEMIKNPPAATATDKQHLSPAQASSDVKKLKKSSKSPDIAVSSFTPYQEKSGENYMNSAQKAHFRQLLLGWKVELMQEVDRTVTHMKDEASNFPDPIDRAAQEEEFSLELRARERERKLIKKIDSTLELIEQDDYGYCDACGIDIGVRRLEVRPTATQCIDCKTLAEIKEKQLSG